MIGPGVIVIVCNVSLWSYYTEAFSPPATSTRFPHQPSVSRYPLHLAAYQENDFYNNDDFGDGEEDDEDAKLFGSLSSSDNEFLNKKTPDLSGGTTRQFALGYDLTLASFAGSMGFDEVVDWEYYDDDDDDDGSRNVVRPPPLDPTQPKRTRSSSGGVVRIFRGELTGRVAGMLRSQGRDNRVLVKEFAGEMAVELAEAELECVGKIQSGVLCGDGSTDSTDNDSTYYNSAAKEGEWANTASSRFLLGQDIGDTRKDDYNLMELMGALSGNNMNNNKMNTQQSLPFVGILGLLNLSNYLNDATLDPNEWYRALGVPPPKPNSIWIVYEYAGLSTLAGYCQQPPSVRLAKLPPKKGIFGNPIPPPPLPPWKLRANYVVNGILRQTLEAVAILHENGVAHRSIGRNSILLSTNKLDKAVPTSIYTTNPKDVSIKISDFGFSGIISESAQDEGFRARARAFGIGAATDERSFGSSIGSVGSGNTVSTSLGETNFAMAEDLHALGFVFLGVLLTTLAELPSGNSVTYNMPKTDEDSLQRLLGEIFERDMEEFREYCEAEEIWTNVVRLLDDHDGAGWALLEKLCFARERAGENKDSLQLVTARGLLSNALFQ